MVFINFRSFFFLRSRGRAGACRWICCLPPVDGLFDRVYRYWRANRSLFSEVLMKAIRSLTLLLAVIAAVRMADRFPFSAAVGAAPAPSAGFVLVAHGGAGDYSNMKTEQGEMRRAAMVKAVQAGYAILARGGPSMDAVKRPFASWRIPGCLTQGAVPTTRVKAFRKWMLRSWMAARSMPGRSRLSNTSPIPSISLAW